MMSADLNKPEKKDENKKATVSNVNDSARGERKSDNSSSQINKNAHEDSQMNKGSRSDKDQKSYKDPSKNM